MTFEEFKEGYFLYVQPTKPEHLEACQREYQAYIQHLDDLNYFEPDEEVLPEHYTYNKSIEQFLKLESIRENQICFVREPFFSEPNLLLLKKENNNYLLRYMIPNSGQYQTTLIDKIIAEKIIMNMNISFAQARKPKASYAVLDGTVYTFIMLVENKLVRVYKHSPPNESKSGKVIFVFEKLIEYCKSPEPELLITITTAIHDWISI